VFVVNRNVLRGPWDGKWLYFPTCKNERFFSKYVILFNAKSICVGHFMFTDFGKNVLILCKLFVGNFNWFVFSEVYLKLLRKL
jgi:hypothetical protein